MKKLLYMCLAVLMLAVMCGCSGGKAPDAADALREYYAGLENCKAVAALSADFGDRVQEFTLRLDYAKNGSTTVEVLEPDEIAGIKAVIDPENGTLQYDDVILETGPLPGGGITPVDALPSMLRVWGAGYMVESGEEKLNGTKVYHIVWRNMSGETEIEHHGYFDRSTFAPVRAEVINNGTMVISCDFELFEVT